MHLTSFRSSRGNVSVKGTTGAGAIPERLTLTNNLKQLKGYVPWVNSSTSFLEHFSDQTKAFLRKKASFGRFGPYKTKVNAANSTRAFPFSAETIFGASSSDKKLGTRMNEETNQVAGEGSNSWFAFRLLVC